MAGAFAPGNSVAVLLAATQRVTVSQGVPVVLADAGVENVNAQIDALLATGVLRRLLAMTELKFSYVMIEAWWCSLKHQWLFLHALDSVATVRRLLAFYVDVHNRVLPHAAFRGQTPDEMYFGAGKTIPAELEARADAAGRARLQANKSATCETRSALNAKVRTAHAIARAVIIPRAWMTRTRPGKCSMSEDVAGRAVPAFPSAAGALFSKRPKAP